MKKSTKNYALFKTIVGNRPVNPGHVRSLVESIKERNLLEKYPIMVNEKMGVVDGQHRLAAAALLGIEVFYEMISKATIKDVQLLNQSNRSWSMKDYLTSYVAQGNNHYKELEKFMGKFEVGVGAAIIMMGTTSFADIQSVRRAFKKGTFEVINKERAYQMGDILLTLRPFMGDYTYDNRNFLRLMFQVYKEELIDFDEIAHILSINGQKIPAYSHVRDYWRFFEDTLNYKKVGKPIRLEY